MYMYFILIVRSCIEVSAMALNGGLYRKSIKVYRDFNCIF